MQFEYQESLFDNRIPSLAIPVSELLKAKDFRTDENARHERELFNKSMSIYSYYCGVQVCMTPKSFDALCENMGKNGKVVFSCARNEEGFTLVCRVISNNGEKIIPCDFITQPHRE